MSLPTFSGIDHFHLYVDDKQQALQWYETVLGFKTVDKLQLWNVEAGPLTIEDEAGSVHLALFKRTRQPLTTSIAFKSSGANFIRWCKHLKQQGLDLRIADHQVAWSMYFRDPFDNMHEITTDEYEYVQGRAELLN